MMPFLKGAKLYSLKTTAEQIRFPCCTNFEKFFVIKNELTSR